jgi:membrane-bound lytic murein transglycosylase D
VRKIPLYPLQFLFLVLILLLGNGCAQKIGHSTEPAAITPRVDAEIAVDNDSELSETVEGAQPLDMNNESDDTSPESEQIKAIELEGLQSSGQWEEGEPADEIEEAEAQYDFPITINRQVEYYLDFFQNKNHETFARWLARSTAYLPFIKERLREEGLPQDLAYLAMIESGFSQTARSRARAVGMWQFIRGTARNYGLKVNSYLDERRDPVKSTRAAVEYLSELHGEFDSWYLAVAAYNAGEGNIKRAMRKHGTANFWELAQGRHLRLETKRYVPKLIAAIIIAKNPKKYGFDDVEYQPPFTYETAEAPRWTALKAVSLAGNVDVQELQNLNRELLKPFTPPDSSTYPLRVPVGKKTAVEKNLCRVHAIVSTSYKTHVVRDGESLNRVCQKYGLTKKIILKTNNLPSATLKAGQRLRIPYRTTKYVLLPEGAVAPTFLAANGSGENFILHKVKPGETVSELALRYNVPAHLIAGWNDLKDISRIRAGQQLAFYIKTDDDSPGVAVAVDKDNTAAERGVPEAAVKMEKSQKRVPSEAAGPSDDESGREMMHYQVRRGDSLWTIARKFDSSVEEIRSWNNLEKDVIFPDTELLIAVRSQTISDGLEEEEKGIYYMVQGGDSLWTIARKFKQSMEMLRKWNNLKGDVIYPGKRLLVKLADVGV